MKFRNIITRGYRGACLEAGAIIGDEFDGWDGSLDPLLVPVDDEARAAYAALGWIDPAAPKPTPQPSPKPRDDIYSKYGVDMLRTGFDTRRVNTPAKPQGTN